MVGDETVGGSRNQAAAVAVAPLQPWQGTGPKWVTCSVQASPSWKRRACSPWGSECQPLVVIVRLSIIVVVIELA